MLGLNEDSTYRLLEDSLEGFEAISRVFRTGFTVTQGMLGLNKASEVRVWLNSDFSKNEPEHQLSGDSREHHIIESLYETVERATEGALYQPYFREEKAREARPYTF